MTLREIKEDDLELMLGWRNHPAIRSKMFSQSIIDFDQHKAWFKRKAKKNDSLWLLFVDDKGIPSGIVYFTDMDKASSHAFWGFYAAPDAPPGTGTSMCREALNYFFNTLKFHKLNAEVLQSNNRSYFFHVKLNFKIEGVFNDHYLGFKGYESVTRFALLADDYI
ncbi:UDP-4-amino-4,6-dideoxy-N-acetyl-beta-L-altrosamine N-acetyltransferase [Vreelandella sulfidaeris]|uniref:UDP-4-amino-4, 6-dideoxy-N-acetyl-beta-L-altrosamine N-acetyltransferase n=1 Tax=Vreelandella sulfidaeris TaxID=115553 RepID=UPI0035E4687B